MIIITQKVARERPSESLRVKPRANVCGWQMLGGAWRRFNALNGSLIGVPSTHSQPILMETVFLSFRSSTYSSPEIQIKRTWGLIYFIATGINFYLRYFNLNILLIEIFSPSQNVNFCSRSRSIAPVVNGSAINIRAAVSRLSQRGIDDSRECLVNERRKKSRIYREQLIVSALRSCVYRK